MEVAKFTISGAIGEPNAELLKELSAMGVYEITSPKQLRSFIESNATADAYEISIDSIGGDAVKGFEMYDLLKQVGRSKPVTTVAYRADSIASVVFLAGQNRKALKGCSFLIHSAWLSPSDLNADVRLNEATLDKIKKVNRAVDSQILAIYSEVAGRQVAGQLADMMVNETKLSARELLQLNFATEIIDGVPKAGSRKALAYNSTVLNLAEQASQHYADVIGMKGDKVLLIQRSAEAETEPNKWTFAGGKIEQGELPEVAAARELNEETGYTAKGLAHIATVQHDNGGTTHFYSAEVEGEPVAQEDEIQKIQFVTIEELNGLEIIYDQKELYNQLIQKAMENTLLEKIAKSMAAMSARLRAMGAPKSMALDLADGQKLFIFSENGELEGKSAVLATAEGEPTETPAPVGTHALADGRSITVGEGGIISSVQEVAAAAAPEDDMAKLMEERDALSARIAAMTAEEEKQKGLVAALQARNAEMEGQLKALNTDFEGLKKIVEEVAGDGKSRSPKAMGKSTVTAEEWSKMTQSQRQYYNFVNAKN